MFEGKKEVMLALSYSLRYLLISIKANFKKKLPNGWKIINYFDNISVSLVNTKPLIADSSKNYSYRTYLE